ncbi:MAG: hypothetical protein RL557_136 [archaeon]|jgi:hypothetical protein
MRRYIFIISIFLLFLTVSAQVNTSAEENASLNQTVELQDIEILKFFPKEVKTGDVAFNIQVKNNLDATFENVYAFISGSGFATYEVIPIETLGPFERDYIFVNGNLKESGSINLTIRIGKYIFYQQLYVFDIEKESENTEEEKKLEQLKELSMKLEDLKKNYTELELVISEKEDRDFDVTDINLEDLKKYIRSTESSILSQEVGEAAINLQLSIEEYKYQKEKVDIAKIIPFSTRIKENALIFSAIFGAILAFFALSELLKTKSQRAYENVTGLVMRGRKKRKRG